MHMTHVSRMAGPIATSTFNQLGQYASSPGTGPLLRRTRRFFPSSDLARPPPVLIVPTHRHFMLWRLINCHIIIVIIIVIITHTRWFNRHPSTQTHRPGLN